MAAKRTQNKRLRGRPRSRRLPGAEAATESPRFPYTTTPGSLRRFLQQVPHRPRPPRINMDTFRSWGIRDSNAQTIVRVLRALNLVDATGAPTEMYRQFMHLEQGPAVLGNQIRALYQPLFANSLEPQRESDDSLRNLFNIHSGGSPRTVELQIQTFKALCEFAIFAPDTGTGTGSGLTSVAPSPASGKNANGSGIPAIHIDLHIHLPENKSRRDYEFIFEDIARHIFQRSPMESGGSRG